MNVTDRVRIDSTHSVEWGGATWDEDDFSIRNRFNSEDGRFNKAGSSELPWTDFNRMIIESIRKRHFTDEQIAQMLLTISEMLVAKAMVPQVGE